MHPQNVIFNVYYVFISNKFFIDSVEQRIVFTQFRIFAKIFSDDDRHNRHTD